MNSIAASGQVAALRIARILQSDGRVSVPVKPSHTIFAQFRHISGIPASAGENPVPISRLLLLDRIASMLRAKKESPAGNFELTDLQFEKTEVKKEYGAMSNQTKAGLVFNLSA